MDAKALWDKGKPEKVIITTSEAKRTDLITEPQDPPALAFGEVVQFHYWTGQKLTGSVYQIDPPGTVYMQKWLSPEYYYFKDYTYNVLAWNRTPISINLGHVTEQLGFDARQAACVLRFCGCLTTASLVKDYIELMISTWMYQHMAMRLRPEVIAYLAEKKLDTTRVYRKMLAAGVLVKSEEKRFLVKLLLDNFSDWLHKVYPITSVQEVSL